jgi:hypothetical protein
MTRSAMHVAVHGRCHVCAGRHTLPCYDVKLDSDCAAYCAAIMQMPPMHDWIEAAKAEPEEVVELDVEF